MVFNLAQGQVCLSAYRKYFLRKKLPWYVKGILKKNTVDTKLKKKLVALVRERTMPTERPPLVGEVVPTLYILIKYVYNYTYIKFCIYRHMHVYVYVYIYVHNSILVCIHFIHVAYYNIIYMYIYKIFSL
jgi:hypothetical protein